jgi:hypothetical protein
MLKTCQSLGFSNDDGDAVQLYMGEGVHSFESFREKNDSYFRRCLTHLKILLPPGILSQLIWELDPDTMKRRLLEFRRLEETVESFFVYGKIPPGAAPPLSSGSSTVPAVEGGMDGLIPSMLNLKVDQNAALPVPLPLAGPSLLPPSQQQQQKQQLLLPSSAPSAAPGPVSSSFSYSGYSSAFGSQLGIVPLSAPDGGMIPRSSYSQLTADPFLPDLSSPPPPPPPSTTTTSSGSQSKKDSFRGFEK